jgi:hypothetical protein
VITPRTVFLLVCVPFIFWLLFMLCGCSTSTANYPLRPNVWNQTIQNGKGVVIYYRCSSQVPREAFSKVGKVQPLGIWGDLAKGVTEGVTDVVPKVANGYTQVRNSNAFSTVEILVTGCKDSEDLEAVKCLLKTIATGSKNGG